MNPTEDKNKQKLSDFSPSYQKSILREMKKHPGISIEQAKKEIYNTRTLRALAKNPDISLSEARGHKPKPLPPEATTQQREERALQEKASNLSLRARAGELPPEKVKEAKKIIRKMTQEVKRMEATDHHTGEEWTLWSQQQKEREVQAKMILNTMIDREQIRAQSIIDTMTQLSASMQKMKPTTKKYAQSLKRLEKLNTQLEGTSFTAENGVAIRGEGYSPEAGKALAILEKMQDITRKMYDKYPTGQDKGPGYYALQDRLKNLYKRLEKLGLVNRSGDLIRGEVGYH